MTLDGTTASSSTFLGGDKAYATIVTSPTITSLTPSVVPNDGNSSGNCRN